MLGAALAQGRMGRRGVVGAVAGMFRGRPLEAQPTPVFDIPAASPAEADFLETFRRAVEERGAEEGLRIVADAARLHAMENGTYLPSNEHPVRFLIRRARETGEDGILIEAAGDLAGASRSPSP